jgi:DNA-binding NarL/FixJ family response regulator
VAARPVLVIEDHAPTLRAMAREVRGAFRAVPCADLAAARRAIAQLRTRPVGVIVDVRLPDGSGLDLLREIREQFPGIGALVVTGSADADIINRSHLLDAAFAVKPHTLANLRKFLQELDTPSPPLVATIDRFIQSYDLTPREHDVLKLLAVGETRARLARKLGIRESSVKTHLKHILRKTGDADVGELIARLLRAVNADQEAAAAAAPAPSNDER